jgi:zinc D-Ala-D-Ala carboxypeptidase
MTIYSTWNDFPKSEWRWPSFSPEEMACRGTGRLMIDPTAMDKLQRLRTRLGKPMILNSAYRSPEHNAAVGGAKNSEHMKAHAFDVRMDNFEPYAFIAAARAEGFTGIGTYPKQGFVHIDIGPARSWGAAFPKRATPGFAPETPREAELLRNDVEARAAAGAGAGATVAVAVGAIPAVSGLMGNLVPIVQGIAVVGALILVGYLIWKRKGRIG